MSSAYDDFASAIIKPHSVYVYSVIFGFLTLTFTVTFSNIGSVFMAAKPASRCYIETIDGNPNIN